MMHEKSLPPAPDTVDIWCRRVSDRQNEELLNNLSLEEKDRFKRFKNETARTGFLQARGFLRQLLGSYLNMAPAAVPIISLKHGKPALPDNLGLHFNLTHSHDLILYAFAPSPVGIDVEFLGRKVDFVPVMRRFFSENERADWQRNSTPSAAAAFFRGWTRKEAFLKATGEGISGLGITEISFQPENPRALVSRKDNASASLEWLFHDFAPAESYMAAVAVKSPKATFNFRNY